MKRAGGPKHQTHRYPPRPPQPSALRPSGPDQARRSPLALATRFCHASPCYRVARARPRTSESLRSTAPPNRSRLAAPPTPQRPDHREREALPRFPPGATPHFSHPERPDSARRRKALGPTLHSEFRSSATAESSRSRPRLQGTSNPRCPRSRETPHTLQACRPTGFAYSRNVEPHHATVPAPGPPLAAMSSRPHSLHRFLDRLTARSFHNSNRFPFRHATGPVPPRRWPDHAPGIEGRHVSDPCRQHTPNQILPFVIRCVCHIVLRCDNHLTAAMMVTTWQD